MPQKQGTPREKATVERAWHTVETAQVPLLHSTCRLAEALPALRCVDLTKALGTILLAARPAPVQRALAQGF